MTIKELAWSAAVVCLSVGASGRAGASFTYYSTQGGFAMAAPPLSTETFETANVAPLKFDFFYGPLNSGTAEPEFNPPGLLPGFTINSTGTITEGSVTMTELVIVGAGTIPGATKLVGNPVGGASLDVYLTGGSLAAGMTLIASGAPGGFAPDVFTVSLYGASGLLDTHVIDVDGVDSYFGFTSSSDLVTKIDIKSRAGGGEFLDNLSFPTTVPEPSSLALCGFAFATAVGVARAWKGQIVE